MSIVHSIGYGLSEDRYIHALYIYLKYAYPDDKPIWRWVNKKRISCTTLTPESIRDNWLMSVAKEPHRSFFFRDGIPTSITFGSWIQPHMKLRYGDGIIWVESNEESIDGDLVCDLSREIKGQIELAWLNEFPDYFNNIAKRLSYPSCYRYCSMVEDFEISECNKICPEKKKGDA